MIKKVYLWKELSNDGLLKEPDPIGPYYDQKFLNGDYEKGFDTEEGAILALEKFYSGDYWYQSNHVLIPIYKIYKQEK